MSDPINGFRNLRASLTPIDNGFTIEIPDAWKQGRTAYGGATAALALESAIRAIPDLPPLRSMLVNFTGPVVGKPVFIPVCARQGKNVMTVEVTVESEKRVAAIIVLTFGRNRHSSLDVPAPMAPLDRPPSDYELFTPKGFESFVPKFVLNFDTRLVAGSRSVSGAEEGYVRVVSRHNDIDSHTGIESLVALADVLPPAALCMAKAFAPVSSATWMMNMLTDRPVTDDGWWQVEARLTSAANGYSSQQMKIWSLGGTAVAEGMQCVTQFF